MKAKLIFIGKKQEKIQNGKLKKNANYQYFSTQFQEFLCKKFCNGGVACSLLKLGENRYSFSIPLWFALRHHFFVEKTMS